MSVFLFGRSRSSAFRPGPMGPDGLRLLLVQLQLATVAFSAPAQATPRNSAICRASSPEGWNKAWALAFSGETSRRPLVTGVLYAKCITVLASSRISRSEISRLMTERRRKGGTEDATHTQYCRAPASHRNDAACDLSARRNCNCRRYEKPVAC